MDDRIREAIDAALHARREFTREAITEEMRKFYQFDDSDPLFYQSAAAT